MLASWAQAAAAFAEDPKSAYNLGHALARTGRFEDALAVFEKMQARTLVDAFSVHGTSAPRDSATIEGSALAVSQPNDRHLLVTRAAAGRLENARPDGHATGPSAAL